MSRYMTARLELALEAAEALRDAWSRDPARRRAFAKLVLRQSYPDRTRPTTLSSGFQPLTEQELRFIKFACALPRFTGQQRLRIALAIDRTYVERQQAEYSKRTARPVNIEEK